MTGDMEKLINEKFTLRGSWAWKDVDGYWNWIMEYPQAKGRSFEGVFEHGCYNGSPSISQQGKNYVSGKQPNNGKEDFEFSSILQGMVCPLNNSLNMLGKGSSCNHDNRLE